MFFFFFFFFFSSRRRHTRCETVTGVQTCALPILPGSPAHRRLGRYSGAGPLIRMAVSAARSEERRVGKDVVSRVDLGGRRIIKKKKKKKKNKKKKKKNKILYKMRI